MDAWVVRDWRLVDGAVAGHGEDGVGFGAVGEVLAGQGDGVEDDAVEELAADDETAGLGRGRDEGVRRGFRFAERKCEQA